MRGGGDDVGVGNRAGVDACGNQTRDVGHVHEEEGLDGFGDFGDALELDDAGIGAGAGDDHFRLVLVGQLFDLVIVDALVILVHAIGDKFVHAAGEVERMTVREVTAVSEIHAQNDVAGLKRGHVDGNVGGGAGVRLHVGMVGAEQFLGTIDGQLLDLVGDFAAAVVALAWIAFGVLVGEDRAHSFEDCFGDEIFAGDQLESGGLALGFLAQ